MIYEIRARFPEAGNEIILVSVPVVILSKNANFVENSSLRKKLSISIKTSKCQRSKVLP